MNEQSEVTAVCSPWDNSQCVGTHGCPPRCPRFFDRQDAPILFMDLKERHLEDLVDMYEKLNQTHRTIGLPLNSKSEIRRWLDTLIEEGWNLVAQNAENQLIGHVGVITSDDTAPEFVISVIDEYQGRGIGSELLRQLVAHSAARGHDALELFVSADNEQAISIYETFDFEVTEERLATIAMRLSLDKPIAQTVQRPPAEQ